MYRVPKEACPRAGSRLSRLKAVRFLSRFPISRHSGREGQGEREIDVLVCAAAGAVFTNPDHVFFKAALTLTAPVPKDKLSGIVFGLKAGNKRRRMTAGRAKRPFDTVGVPKPL